MNRGDDRDRVAVRPVEALPPLAAMLSRLQRPGAALLHGWSDGEPWTIFLPWPEERIGLSWKEMQRWREVIARIDRIRNDDDPLPTAPFLGGWVGHLAYELGAAEEGAALPDPLPPEPPIDFTRHRSGLIASEGACWIFAPPSELDTAERRARELMPQEERRAAAISSRSPLLVRDSLERVYASRVEAIREAIARGDVYQINLTRRFETGPVDPAELHQALIGEEPPRCSAFLHGDGWSISSASPEIFLRFDRRTGIAESRPIKGTVRRERGREGAEIATLLSSEKDDAEHLMIVDLVRNDLGKVAHDGAVSVPEYRTVRTLAHVHHLESTVRAAGLDAVPLGDLIAALFPAGSITGAPKRAAVQMIRQLEPVARGVYTGAIGFHDLRGRTELSVAIRTAVATPGGTRYHAGGGIVWESDAEAEDDETIAKSAAFLDFVGARR